MTFCSIACCIVKFRNVTIVTYSSHVFLRYMGQIVSIRAMTCIYRILSDAFYIDMRQLRENRYGKYYVYPRF